MTRPETLFEQASYDLNKFRERRVAERRAVLRDSPDRRRAQPAPGDTEQHGMNAGEDRGTQPE